MGMYASLHKISPAQLDRVRASPSLTERLLDPDDEEFGGDWWPEGPILELDKAWHVIHFLLTGDEWGGSAPLKDAIVGGTEIGPDLGTGPARFLTAEEVRAVSAALGRTSESDLRSRFDPAALDAAQIYPGMWKPAAPPKRGLFGRAKAVAPDKSVETKELAEFLDFAMERFRALVTFYTAAAGNGDAMLLVIG